jgi:hypothetical protein
MYTTRKIEKEEMIRIGMSHPEFCGQGWAVVRLVADTEEVMDWYADRYVAVAEAAQLNEDESD